MAYNSYFPATYQPNLYGFQNPYHQQMQNQQMIQQVQQQNQSMPQIQHSGFVLVQSEQEARAYPVAPGNSVTFKDESQPYCYVKTMGFNQLDRPTFERYRLVKEDVTPDTVEISTNTSYALKSDITSLWEAINNIKSKLTESGKVAKTEVKDNEE